MKVNTLIVLVVTPILGCASTHTADIEGRADPYRQKGRIQWNSSKLKHSLEIEKAAVERTETGLMQVRLVIRNKLKKDVFVDIRTLFTDEEGFEQEKTNWEPICCTARTQTTYQTVSLNPGVQDYQVIIREPKTFSSRKP
jgi:uncharacterized protein YcfL